MRFVVLALRAGLIVASTRATTRVNNTAVTLPVTVRPPLAWISPNAVRLPAPPGAGAAGAGRVQAAAAWRGQPRGPPRGRFVLWSGEFRRVPVRLR